MNTVRRDPYAALDAVMAEAGLVSAHAHPVTGESYLTRANKAASGTAAGSSP